MLAPNTPPSDADLVHRYNELRAWKEQEEAALAEKLKPATEGMEAIKGEMLRRLNERSPDVTKKANSKTEHGTAFRVRHVRAKVVGLKFLDWCLDNWEKGGSDMLKVEAVTAGFADEKGAFYEYVASHKQTVLVNCPQCHGSGFDTPGTGYGNVCGHCGGQKQLPQETETFPPGIEVERTVTVTIRKG